MARAVTILLVEDNESIRTGIHDLLEMADFGYDATVYSAEHGLAALDILQQEKVTPTLIISDVMMPKMNGYEFLEQVRAQPQWRTIPFIFVTAKGEKEDKRKGKLSDADLYITKPFVINELLQLVQTQLDRKVQDEEFEDALAGSLKKNLLQILNHEFRTPLTYVTAYYEMLSASVEQYQDGQDYSEYLRGIRAGNIRLTRLVEDFILVMSLRSGEAAELFAREAGLVDNLPELIDAAVIVKQWDTDQWRVDVINEVPAALPPIWGDVASLQSILKRLLDNAIKFTGARFKRLPERGKVVITAVADEDEVRIAIEDQGMGIPTQALEHIFDLFEQHDRNVMEQQGTGMGLVIVDGLVKMHNGRIDIDSTVGAGSIFTIVLPIHKDGDARPAASTEVRKRAKILIVEDDPHLREGLADLLELHNERYELEICTAVNGVAGLAALEAAVPDLIISDIMMPQMDGYTFLQTVRKNPQWFRIPFIFLTAKGEKQDEFEGFRLGVDEYITKPYDSDDMLLFVTKRLDRHFASKEKQAQNFNELKRSIINLITPEFLVPLDTVSESSARLAMSLERADTEVAMKQSLEGIYQGSVRLTALIEDVIALAELRTGESQTVFNIRSYVETNINLIVQDMLQRLANELVMDGWDLQVASLPESVPVLTDTAFLLNAIERLIYIGVSLFPKAEPAIRVWMEPMIPPQFALHIAFMAPLTEKDYEIFQQVLNMEIAEDLSALPRYAPSLYVCRGYVHLHNGRLQINPSPTDSLTFTITIPRHTPEN